jgi:hypothetical protein
VFDQSLRDRLNWVVERYYGFVTDFAEQGNDNTYQIRMALALARSFFTSTRFEMNRCFANDMVLRAHFLLEKVLDHKGKPLEEFHLPTDVLYY